MKSIKKIGLFLVTGMLAMAAFGCSGGDTAGSATPGPGPAGRTGTPVATATP